MLEVPEKRSGMRIEEYLCRLACNINDEMLY